MNAGRLVATTSLVVAVGLLVLLPAAAWLSWRGGLVSCYLPLEPADPWPDGGRPGLPWQRDPFAHIAHAGGGIDGLTYTDSEEAVLASLQAGYHLIELDLLVTADGVVVAAHDWEHFKRLAGLPPERVDASPLTLAEFKAQRIAGHLTPLDETRIREIMVANPQLVLVTDKLRDLERLREAFPFQERLIVEVFDRDDFEHALRLGFPNPMFSVANLGRDLDFLVRDEVRFIAADTSHLRARPDLFRRLRRAGKMVFAFNSDDEAFMGAQLGCTASAFYNDHWSLQRGACAAGPCRTY